MKTGRECPAQELFLKVELAGHVPYNRPYMATPTNQANETTAGALGRRSTRLSIAIPIAISGRNAAGAAFKENSRTITVNKHGAKISTAQPLTLGTEIVIENRHLGGTARANVVWLGERKGLKEPVEVGVQLTEASNIWGIEFPPEDWQEASLGEVAQTAKVTTSERPILPAPGKVPEGPAAPKGSRAAGAWALPVKAPETAKAAIPARPIAPAAPLPSRAQPPSRLSSPQVEPVTSAAIEGLNAQAEKTVENYARIFEEKVARVGQEMGFKAQAQLQQAANALEEKLLATLKENVAKLRDDLGASEKELESLLIRYGEIKESGAREVEKTKQNLEAAGFAALESAVERLNEATEKELREVRQVVVNETRKRVGEEAAASVEKFGQEASTRLVQLAEEHLSRVEPEVRERAARTLDELAKRAGEVIQASETDFQERVRKVSEGALAAVREEARALAAREVESRRGEVVAAVEQEIGGRSVEAIESFSKEALARLAGHGEELLARTEADFKAREEEARIRSAEEVRKAIEAATGEGLNTLAKASAAEVASLEAQFDKAAKRAQEKASKELSEYLNKTTEELLAPAAKELQKNLAEARGALKEDLKSTWKTLADEAKKQLGSMAGTTVDSLNQEVKVGLDEFRNSLKKSARDSVEKAARELEGDLQKAVERERQEHLKRLEKESSEACGKALKEFEDRISLAAQAQAETLGRLPGAVAEAGEKALAEIRERAERAAEAVKDYERRESTLRQLGKKLEDVGGQALAAITGQGERTLAEVTKVAAGIRSETEVRQRAATEALDKLRAKTEQAVKEASDAVNMHVGSGTVFLKELEGQAQTRLETLSAKMEGLARSSEAEFERLAAEFSSAAMEGLRASSDALVERLQERLQETADEFSAHGAESLQARFEAITEKLVEESAAVLAKQSRENVEMAATKLEEQKEKVVNEAEDSMRAKLAEAFASVFRPGGRRAIDRIVEESQKKP